MHQTFWKPEKQPKQPKNSLGRKKVKKEVSPLKQQVFANHTPGKTSAERNEFPRQVIAELIAEADGLCQHCKSAPDTTTHHIWPRGRKGRGVKKNGLRLCWPCHDMIQTSPDLLNYYIEIHRDRFGDHFWYDEMDWEEHNRRVAEQNAILSQQEARRERLEPLADLVTTATGRPLKSPERRLLDSMDDKELQTFTGLLTDALNGYAANGGYRPHDRFED